MARPRRNTEETPVSTNTETVETVEGEEAAEAPAAKRPYKRKTPAEKAQFDYDKAVKERDAVKAKLDGLESREELEKQLAHAQRTVDFRASDPNLPEQPSSESSES